MMFFIYILKSQKDNGLYIGFTANLKTRFGNHTNGNVISTRNRRPLKLIFYESFISKRDAQAREKYLKSGHGRDQIKLILKETLGDRL